MCVSEMPLSTSTGKREKVVEPAHTPRWRLTWLWNCTRLWGSRARSSRAPLRLVLAIGF